MYEADVVSFTEETAHDTHGAWPADELMHGTPLLVPKSGNAELASALLCVILVIFDEDPVVDVCHRWKRASEVGNFIFFITIKMNFYFLSYGNTYRN